MRGGYGSPLTSIDVLGLCLRLVHRGPLDPVLEGGGHVALPRSLFTRTFVLVSGPRWIAGNGLGGARLLGIAILGQK